MLGFLVRGLRVGRRVFVGLFEGFLLAVGIAVEGDALGTLVGAADDTPGDALGVLVGAADDTLGDALGDRVGATDGRLGDALGVYTVGVRVGRFAPMNCHSVPLLSQRPRETDSVLFAVPLHSPSLYVIMVAFDPDDNVQKS